MIVSILQRLASKASRYAGEPLQSRAEALGRSSRAKGRGGEVRVSICRDTAGAPAKKSDNQLKDKVGLTKVSLARSQHGDHPEAASTRRPA